MAPVKVVLLVLGILTAQVLIWIPIILWMKRRSAQLVASLRDELVGAGESPSRGPEAAVYRGGTHGYSKVKGNGVIALTARRLVFRKLVGAGLEVPLDQVTGLREDKWFLRAYRGGRLHLILQMKGGGEVGFMVADHAGWMAALHAMR